MYSEIDSNNLESVQGKGNSTMKGKKTNILYPSPFFKGKEKKVSSATTSPKRVTKKSGARKYVAVKKTAGK